MLSSSEILKRTNAEGGITLLNLREFKVDSGYIVGGVVRGAVIPCNDEELLSDILVHHTQHGHRMLGTWFNDGHIHIDVVEWIESRDEALELGKQCRQIAIWDCANNKEVRVS